MQHLRLANLRADTRRHGRRDGARGPRRRDRPGRGDSAPDVRQPVRDRRAAECPAPRRAGDDHGRGVAVGPRSDPSSSGPYRGRGVTGGEYRPRRQPRPPDERLRPVRRLPRRCGPRPGPVRGQADRRAVGRGPGRLRARRLPAGWSEWNGRYRDTVRDFWRSTPGTLGDFATRITGSSDLYGRGRRPTASVNLVTVHDGFTLSDLVSYDAKHNEANGEGNRDGSDDNRSWNCGVEGPTDDPAVLALRARQRATCSPRSALRGHPAAARRRRARPHAGRQQQRLLPGQRDQLDRLGGGRHGADRVRRAALPPATRAAGPATHALLRPGDVRWLRPDGMPMEAGDWSNPDARAVTVAVGDGALLVNAWWEPLTFRLPGDGPWSVELDTADPGSRRVVADTVELTGRSLALLAVTRFATERRAGRPAPGSTWRANHANRVMPNHPRRRHADETMHTRTPIRSHRTFANHARRRCGMRAQGRREQPPAIPG